MDTLGAHQTFSAILQRAINAENRLTLTRLVMHELRGGMTPLLGSIHNLELLSKHSPALTETLPSSLFKSEHRIQALTTALLSLMDTETPGPASVWQILDRVNDIMAPIAHDGDIQLNINKPSRDISIAISPSLALACLSTVISNAVKATRSNPGAPNQVSVDTVEKQAQVGVIITDSGKGFQGINPELLMAPGYSGTGSTGFGLSAVGNLLGLGNVTFDDVADEKGSIVGARVTLFFPLSSE